MWKGRNPVLCEVLTLWTVVNLIHGYEKDEERIRFREGGLVMEIIPAIDIIDGCCVRLSQGAYDQKKVYDTDPLNVARRYEDAGLSRLHLVDLDGARSGHVVNTAVLERIASGTRLVVDFGGGVKSDEDLLRVFDCGASQVTCGSVAARQPDMVFGWLERWGADRLILGADCRDGRIATVGWTEKTDLEVGEFIARYLRAGLRRVICTDIACDGMLGGPSLELYRRLIATMSAEGLPMELIASGGVSSVEDLLSLRKAGLTGAIVGKAIYERRITLDALVSIDNASGGCPEEGA